MMEHEIGNKGEKYQSKEYQIPELVDLNSISEAMGSGTNCLPGSSAASFCTSVKLNII
jgi:hypothetical protein